MTPRGFTEKLWCVYHDAEIVNPRDGVCWDAERLHPCEPKPVSVVADRGFVHCNQCEGAGEVKFCPLCNEIHRSTPPYIGCTNRCNPCPSCSGSGLLPTEQLREEILVAIRHYRASPLAGYNPTLADAVLAKVAEHIKEER